MIEGGEDRGLVGDIEGARERAPPVRLEGLQDGGELLLVAAVEDDRRPGRGETARDREAEAIR